MTGIRYLVSWKKRLFDSSVQSVAKVGRRHRPPYRTSGRTSAVRTAMRRVGSPSSFEPSGISKRSNSSRGPRPHSKWSLLRCVLQLWASGQAVAPVPMLSSRLLQWGSDQAARASEQAGREPKSTPSYPQSSLFISIIPAVSRVYRLYTQVPC